MFEKLLAGFSPRIGLQTLCKLMPERVGHPVERYEMRFFSDEKRIDFLIYMPEQHFQTLLTSPADVERSKMIYKYNNEKRCHLYKFQEGEKICSIAMKLIEPKLPKNYKLQYAIIIFDENSPEITCEAYGLNNDVKEKQTITL